MLTFPVETMALLTDENGDCKDPEWGEFTAEMYSEGHSFFTYMSNNADSLSSCCRLRNEITEVLQVMHLVVYGILDAAVQVDGEHALGAC